MNEGAVRAGDSARWCEHCQAWGDHHTDRHPQAGERPDAIPEGIDLMICECGARWFGGNTKYCPSGHAYRFRTERYIRTAHPEAGSEEADRLRDAARAFVRETGVAHPAIARIPADAPAAVRYDQTRAALLALLDAHPEADRAPASNLAEFQEGLTRALNRHGVPAMPSWDAAIDWLAEHGSHPEADRTPEDER